MVDKSVVKSSIEFAVARLRLILKELKKRDEILYYRYDVAGAKHLEFHKSQAKIKIMKGGNRSGKTTAMIQEMFMLMMGEHPFRKDFTVPSRWWFIVSDFKKLVESGGIWQKLKEQAPTGFRFIDDKNGYKVIAPNKSELTVKSVEQGVKAFTTASLNGFAVDERISGMTEIGKNIQAQIRARIVDYPDSIGLITADPLGEDEWLDLMHIEGSADMWFMEARDNKFIPVSEIELLEKDLSDIQAARVVYGKVIDENIRYLYPEGDWSERNYIEIPPTRSSLNTLTGELMADESGLLRVFKDRDEDKQYIISVDIAEGAGRDDSVVDVWDAFDKEQVAVWHDNQTGLASFYGVVQFLTLYYKTKYDPWLIIENKMVGAGIMSRAREDLLICNFLYQEYKEVSKTWIWGIRPEKDVKLQLVVNSLEVITGQHSYCMIHYKETYKQFLNFVRHRRKGADGDKFSYKGRGTKHDDLVITVLMIARAFANSEYFEQDKITHKYLVKSGVHRKEEPKFYSAIYGDIKVPFEAETDIDIMAY